MPFCYGRIAARNRNWVPLPAALLRRLNVSEGTIKVHLHSIYEKLKVDGRLALARYAQEKGLI